MYHEYFGLKEAPFSIAVNPRYLFMSARHRDALAHLLYGVGAGGGFILLTGPVGTGKTTINRSLLQQLPDNIDIALILNPALNAVELLATVCDELNIPHYGDGQSLKSLTDSLHNFLMENFAKGRNTVLLIDEAQHLQFEVLEQIRLLTNLETNTKKLLQIILVGQPELQTLLAKPELSQLAQRITARYQLKALNLDETESYIRHRLHVAGLPASQEIFPKGIIKSIYNTSKGIPRLINVLCDRMLLGTYGQNKTVVDKNIMRQAIIEVTGEDSELTTNLNKPAIAAGIAAITATGLLAWQLLSAPTAAPLSQVQPLPLAASAIQATAVHAVETATATAEQATAEPAITELPDSADEVVAVAIQELNDQQDSTADSTGKAIEESGREVKQPSSAWVNEKQLAVNELSRFNDFVFDPAGSPCSRSINPEFRCEVLTVDSWQALQDFDRPSVITLITAAKLQYFATLVGIDGDHAILSKQGQHYRQPLAELGELWTGEFLFIWQPPEGFNKTIARGDSGPAVDWLASRFAELDQQSRPLAEHRFNSALSKRVMIFQAEQQLQDDGVAGLKTLLKLNQILGLEKNLEQHPDNNATNAQGAL